MLNTYILVALLAFVLIAIIVLGKRSQNASLGRRQPESDAAASATVAKADTGADSPKAASPTKHFDPDATQVHMRQSVVTAAVPREREGESPVALAGARLVCLSGSRKGSSFPIAAAGISVGRAPSCDIVLADPLVSANHAWIGIVNGKLMLRDLKSTNGTFLNAQTHSCVRETELRPGDTIFFGGHLCNQFRFVTG